MTVSEDTNIYARIKALVDEEHALDQEASEADRQQRRRHIETELDQCWDLLRQRQARRSAGQSPDGVADVLKKGWHDTLYGRGRGKVSESGRLFTPGAA